MKNITFNKNVSLVTQFLSCSKQRGPRNIKKLFFKIINSIVHKGVSTPHFKIITPVTRILSFLKIPHYPNLPANWSSKVFLINRSATVRLSSINTIHIKRQHNVGFFIFKFTRKYMRGIIKYMLRNVYL